MRMTANMAVALRTFDDVCAMTPLLHVQRAGSVRSSLGAAREPASLSF